MKELLSSEEIDTLLELFRAEGGGLDAKEEQILRAAAKSNEDERCEPVDLLQPRRFPRRLRDRFERLFGSIDRGVAATFADRLRLESTCECVSVERVRWAEWANRSRQPAAVFSLDLGPLAPLGVLAISGGLFHGAVDRLLGGAGRADDTPRRVTAAEFGVAEVLVGPLLQRIGDALATLADAKPAVLRRVGDVHLARCAGDHDPVLAVRWQVSSGALSGELRLVVPFAEVERAIERAVPPPEPGVRPGLLRERVAVGIRDVPVELRVVLGRSQLAMQELLDLRIGDVVRLGARVGEPIEGLVQGRSKLRGLIGPRQGLMAFRVTDGREETRDGTT